MDIDQWKPKRVVNYRESESMERRQEWLAFVAELTKQMLLNYRRHLFPDYVIQTENTIFTPTDLNRMLRERETAKKRLGLVSAGEITGEEWLWM